MLTFIIAALLGSAMLLINQYDDPLGFTEDFIYPFDSASCTDIYLENNMLIHGDHLLFVIKTKCSDAWYRNVIHN